ncbi:MAG: CPBP family intramembrane glutamic endopeptidase, partial [Bacteroidales bacterium]
IPTLLGPPVVGIFFTYLLYGREGLRSLLARFLRWKVPVKWYLLALFFVPVTLSLILFILSCFSPAYYPKIFSQPDKINFVITGVLTGLFGGGLFEEIGWTGFATPELRKRFGVVKTGLILGFFWGLWHFLPVYWGSGNVNGELDWSLFLPGLFCHYTVLVPYRVLLVWLHEQTKSLPPVILMHASLTAFILFILNLTEGGLPLFVYYTSFSVILWVLVIWVRRTHCSSPSK